MLSKSKTQIKLKKTYIKLFELYKWYNYTIYTTKNLLKFKENITYSGIFEFLPINIYKMFLIA